MGEFLRPYKHLTNMNIADNDLRDISEVAFLEGCLQLKASGNQVTSLMFLEERSASLKHLQFLDLTTNQIKEIGSLPQPMLSKVALNENQIASMEKFTGHPRLRIMELRKNQLTTCLGLSNMENLVELFLTENQITNFKDLCDLPNLKKLDLNLNKITSLKADEMPCLPALEYLDLGANLIEAPADGGISNLACFADTLKTLILSGNPFADALGDGVTKEVLLTIPTIKMVGEAEVTEEDHTAAKELRKEREKEAEDARLAAERKANGEGEPEGEGEGEGEDD